MGDLFISYSRKDKEFVQVLHQALTKKKYNSWVDWEDIPLTADWWEEVKAGIEGADDFVFIISPDSINSKVCTEEIEHAVHCNKRLVPIVRRDDNLQQLHPALAKHNWLFFRESDDFDTAFQSLVQAIDTDLDYVKAHTRLLVRGCEWDRKGRDPSFLLRGSSLQEAGQWLNQSTNKKPKPTALHLQYIIASSQAQNKRQRLTIAAVAFGLVVVTGLAVVALWEWRETRIAREQAQIAEIEAWTEFSQASLLTDDQLEALIASMKAAKKLQELRNVPNRDRLSQEVEDTLRQAVYKVVERNWLEGHEETVYRVAFSSNGQLIASASEDGTVKLWKPDGQKHQTFSHKAAVKDVSFSPDSQEIASASDDKTVKLWNQNGTLEKTFPHSVPVTSVLFPPPNCPQGIIASAGRDGLVRLWNIEGKLQGVFKAHQTEINDLSASPDCQTIATASNDKTVRLWTWQGKLQGILEGHEDTVWEVNFSPDGQSLATASSDTTVKLWKRDGKLLNSLDRHENWVRTVIFFPDGHEVASGSDDNTVKLWNRDGTLLKVFQNANENGVISLTVSPDGKLVVLGSADGTIKLWKVGGMVIKTLRGHGSSVQGVRFSPSSSHQLIASVSRDRTLRFWKRHSREGLMELEKTREYEAGLRKVDFTADGKTAITVSYDNTLQLWDISQSLSSQQSIRPRIFQGHTGTVNNFSISPDSQILASASADGTVRLWKLDGTAVGKPLFHCPEVTAEYICQVTDVSFSPDGNSLVSVGSDGLVKVWDTNGQLRQILEGHQGKINGVMFSPDGKLIATASQDKNIILWKQDEEGNFVYSPPLKGHQDWVWDVAFSPDGKLIASAGKDRTVRLWNRNGELIVTLRVHKDWVRAVSFSPDHKLLASASADKTIILWDLQEILKIETTQIEKESVIDSLLKRGCDWLSDYLETNPEVNSNILSTCSQ